jgi:hypothetical protein
MPLIRSPLLPAALLAGLALAQPATAQPMLYEQRLPDGFAFVRIANGLPAGAVVRPDFGDAVTLGEGGADRVSPYYVAEDVARRPVKFQVTTAGTTTEVQASVAGGGLNTILLQREGERVVATSIPDKAEYNQTRARVTFYNAVPGCAGGALALDPSGQSVFSGVAPNTGSTRSLNPTQANVRASCATQRAATLDLGRLQPGGLYSVWLMAPSGQPVSFIMQDRIAPR